MGFFDLGLSDVIGGALGFLGQQDTNETAMNIASANNAFNAEQAAISRGYSAEEAHKQREFQREMSSTSYQRATQDLKAAGLNPMLAYHQGGASTPSGAMGASTAASASAPPTIGNKFAAGIQSATAYANMDVLKSQAEKNRAEAKEADVRAQNSYTGIPDLQKSQAELNRATASLAPHQADEIRSRIQLQAAEAKRAGADTARIEQDTARIQQETANLLLSAAQISQATKTLAAQATLHIVNAGLSQQETLRVIEATRNAVLEGKRIAEVTDNQRLNNLLKSLDFPEAQNRAHMESTWYGKYIKPYLPGFLQGATSAQRIDQIGK